MSIGPVDVAILPFPGSRFSGEIAAALATLVADGIVRIIDLLVINKADNDSLTSVEIGGLDANLRPQFSQVTVAFSGQLIDDKDVEASMNALAPAAPAR